MKTFKRIADLFVAAGLVLATNPLYAGGKGVSGFAGQFSGNGGTVVQSSGPKFTPQFQTPKGLNGTVLQSGGSTQVLSGKFKPVFPSGNGNGSSNGVNLPIIPGVLGQGKNKPNLPIIPGVLGTNKNPNLPIIPGVLGTGKNPNLPIIPGVLGTGKTPNLPIIPGVLGGNKPPKIPIIDPGFGNGKPKIPICPPYPYPFPKYPPIGCWPCPGWFNNWCWFPGFTVGGFTGCYGYVGGVCLPTVTTQTVIVEMPALDVIQKGALPQVVPGTTVGLNLANLGSDQGLVMLELGTVAMPVKVEKWENGRLEMTIPMMALKSATVARLLVFGHDGSVVLNLECELVSATVAKS